MSKRKNDDDKIKKSSVGNNSGNVGYSEAALAKLDTGSYGTTTNRKPKATTSSSQITVTKTIPVLNGATTSTTISTSPNTTSSVQPVSVTKNSSHSDGLNTTRARQNYSQSHKPIGTSLSKKDSDTLYKFFDRNRLSLKTNGTAPIVRQLKTNMWTDVDDWEQKYGKPIEQIVEDYAKDFDQISAKKDKEYGEKHPVLATLKNVFNGGTTESALDTLATLTNTVAPNSNLAKAYKNATEEYSKQKKQVKEGVTSDMGNVGKTAYEMGTGAAEKVLQYASPSKAKYILTLGKTAENTRQNLKERGIDDTSLGARGQSLAAGAVDTLLDIKGLDSIKGLKGLQQSGNLAKSLIGSAAIGGGEQALTSIINEAVDRIANKDKSIYNTNVQNYMAQGMSQKDAKDKAWSDEINSVMQEAGMGALFGAAMGTGGQVARKAANTVVDAATGRNIPSLWTPTKEPVIENAIKQSQDAAGEIERLSQQIPKIEEARNERNLERIQDTVPGTRKEQIEQIVKETIPDENRVAAEKAETNPTLTEKVDDITNHPRYKKPLEGADLDNANQAIKQNKTRINEIEQKIDAIEKSKKGKKLNQTQAKEVKALKAEKKQLLADNTSIRKDIKGGITPVKDLLSDDAKKSLFGKFDSVYSDLYVAKKIAGETKQATQLVNDAKKHLGNYIESGDINDLKIFYGSAAELQELAERTGGKYVTKSGEYSYNDWFGTGTNKYTGETENLRLLDSVDNRIPYKELESLNKTNIAAESAPVRRSYRELMPENPYFETENYNNLDDQSRINLRDQARAEQLQNYEYTAPRPATQTEYQGFDITKGTNSDVQDALDTGKAFIAEMSPLEYLQRSAYDIEDTSALEGVINGANSIDKVSEYADAMRRGDRFPILSLTYEGKSGRGQEGRTRALAAYEAGIDTIPVAIIGEASENPRNISSRNIEPDIPKISDEDLEAAVIEDLIDEDELAPIQEEPVNVPPIPPETPRMDEIPTSGENGQSRVVTHTGINSDIISQEDYDTNPIYKELASYAKHNNEVTYDSAMQNVRKEGTVLLDDYINGKRKIDNDLDVDQAMILLTNMSSQLKTQGENAPSDLLSQRNLLFSKLREAGTQYGQLIQAFKKWNNTAEGAIVNGESMLTEPTKKWKSRNKKTVQLNSRIAKAFENMGVDASMRNRESQPKTHDEIKAGVIKVLEREYGSVEGLFNDNDIEFLTTLAEDKRIPIWQITDEIEHKLNFGDWYTLDESIEPKLPENQRLRNALNDLIEREPAPEKEPLTPEQIREQVRNTINNEYASFNSDFTDEDIDYLSNLIQNGATKSELSEALNTKLATGRFGISANTQNRVNLLFEEANHYDPNSREAVEARSEAYALIANEVAEDASLLEKFEAWRYLAMLGNPKTMVRNMVGNKLFGVVTGVSNNIAAALEAGTDRAVKALGGEGIQRTKTFLSPSKDRELINACANDGDAHRYSEISGTKYEKGTKDAIRQQKSVFNNKLIQLYEKATDKGISDYNAVKSKYSTSLAGYLKSNGYDESIFDADNTYRGLKEISRRRLLTDAEQMQMENARQSYEALEKARDYAVKEAEYATFHEDNAVAQLLSKHSQDFRNSDNPAARALGYMIEGIVPFKKTPANILRSGIEYSPLNVAKSLVHTARLAYENTGSRKENLEDTYTKKSALSGKEKEITKLTASEVLDDWAKTVTGTGLVGLGMYLANNGVLNLSNKDEKYQDDLEGIQNYSLKIGDKTYTLDWAAPAVMPLLVGAEISNINKRNGLLSKKAYENFDEIVGTINALLDPIFETSMMQGVKNTLESAANEVRYNDDGAMGGILGSMATNTLTGYLTQGLPTLSGQIARTVDPTRRATDVATSQNFLGGIEKQGRKLMNKIPGLSYANEAYRDAYGRTQQNSPFDNTLGNLGYQMLSPAYIRDINTTEADRSARNAYYAPGVDGVPVLDSKVFATWKGTVKDSGHKFDPQEMSAYRQSSGEANYAIRDALAKEGWFNQLDGDKQTEILKKVNTLVDKIGKETAGYPQDDDDLSVYKSGGIPALLDKYHDKQIKKQIEQTTGVKANSKVGEELKDAIKSGDKQAIEQATAKANKYAKEKQAEEKQIAADEQKIVDSIGTKAKTAEDLGIESKTYVKIGNKAGKNAEKVYNAIPSLKRNGLGSSSAYYTYADALSVDPNLSTADFIKTFNSIDADNSKGIKQDELITYFNGNNVSQEQANKYWKMYGDPEWKKIPKLEGGKYKKVAK